MVSSMPSCCRRADSFDVQEEDENAASPFDSNVIAPVTPFIAWLAKALRIYVAECIGTVLAWKDLRVLFIDSSVPSEYDRKIAEFVQSNSRFQVTTKTFITFRKG